MLLLHIGDAGDMQIFDTVKLSLSDYRSETRYLRSKLLNRDSWTSTDTNGQVTIWSAIASKQGLTIAKLPALSANVKDVLGIDDAHKLVIARTDSGKIVALARKGSMWRVLPTKFPKEKFGETVIFNSARKEMMSIVKERIAVMGVRALGYLYRTGDQAKITFERKISLTGSNPIAYGSKWLDPYEDQTFEISKTGQPKFFHRGRPVKSSDPKTLAYRFFEDGGYVVKKRAQKYQSPGTNFFPVVYIENQGPIWTYLDGIECQYRDMRFTVKSGGFWVIPK